MAPKKRTVESANETNPAGSDKTSGDLRRSTRGGGHIVPTSSEGTTKIKSTSKTSSTGAKGTFDPTKKESSTNKKAKVDTTASSNGNGSKTDEGIDEEMKVEDSKVTTVGPLDSAEKTAETIDDKDPTTGVQVPESNKKEAQSTKRIEVGDMVPKGIVLKNEKDENVDIGEITSDKGAVFFVYPKANTPGCTTQACLFRDAYAEFGPLGYEVYGLSSDSPTAQSNWKSKNSFPYPLLCDPAQLLLKLLGAAKGVKSNQRSHYIVEKGGKLVDAKYTISPKESAEGALEWIKKNSATAN